MELTGINQKESQVDQGQGSHLLDGVRLMRSGGRMPEPLPSRKGRRPFSESGLSAFSRRVSNPPKGRGSYSKVWVVSQQVMSKSLGSKRRM